MSDDVIANADVHVGPDGQLTPTIVLAFDVSDMPVTLSASEMERRFVAMLTRYGWASCAQFYDSGTLPTTTAQVSVRVDRSGNTRIETADDVLYDGSLAAAQLWHGLALAQGQVLVVASASIRPRQQPTWRDALTELAARGLVVGAAANVTVPANWAPTSNEAGLLASNVSDSNISVPRDGRLLAADLVFDDQPTATTHAKYWTHAMRHDPVYGSAGGHRVVAVQRSYDQRWALAWSRIDPPPKP